MRWVSFKEAILFQERLVRIMSRHVVEIPPPSIWSFQVVCVKYGFRLATPVGQGAEVYPSTP